MRVLGIDPGLATVGLGVVDAPTRDTPRAIEWLTIETKAGTPLQERLLEIERDLTEYLEHMKPALVVIEKLFFAKNETTALDVAHARGVMLSCVARRSIPLLCPSPSEMKLGITGDGSADKLQVQTMLQHVLHLTEIPRPDDAADALALALFGVLTGLPHADISVIAPPSTAKVASGRA
jgi:crossover junction endodeoxyribonuclease RuvC